MPEATPEPEGMKRQFLNTDMQNYKADQPVMAFEDKQNSQT